MENYNYVLHQLNEDILNLERGIDLMAYLDNIKVELIETEPKNILFSRQKMSIDEYCKYFGKLFAAVAKEQLTCIGAPTLPFITMRNLIQQIMILKLPFLLLKE